jgi:hypothetical protein
MGRRIVRIADVLVGVVLASGMNAGVRPQNPLKDVKVIDARFRDYLIELLIESPDLHDHGDALWDTAPELDITMVRHAVLEGDVAVQVVADHMRNADGFCDCVKSARTDGYICAKHRSQAALDRVPHALLEQARAALRVAGEHVPDDPDDRHGEVPGS